MSFRKLQSALPDLIGRTIKHIVVCAHEDRRTQLFLHFTDGTYYEFYGRELTGTRHLDVGGVEVSRPGGYIPLNGRLDVLDANTSTVTERAVAPIGATPT